VFLGICFAKEIIDLPSFSTRSTRLYRSVIYLGFRF